MRNKFLLEWEYNYYKTNFKTAEVTCANCYKNVRVCIPRYHDLHRMPDPKLLHGIRDYIWLVFEHKWE